MAKITPINQPGSTGGGLSADEVVAISEGLDLIAADAALASSGQAGRTTNFVSAPPNNEATSDAPADDDETAAFGITPESIRAEIREDDGGFLRRRNIDASGVETWVLA